MNEPSVYTDLTWTRQSQVVREDTLRRLITVTILTVRVWWTHLEDQRSTTGSSRSTRLPIVR